MIRKCSSRYFWLAMLLATPAAVQAAPEMDGRWIGRTTCPLGAVEIEVTARDGTGTFRHSGYGEQKLHPTTFPIKLEAKAGWEGEWIYFQTTEGDSSADWRQFNGLLAKDGSSIHVRGVALGDCREFRLVRVVDQPVRAPVVKAAPGGREPTEAEMRSAVEYALQGNQDAREINAGLSGAKIRLEQFQKLDCVRATGKPGYACDYTASVDMRFHSNEGTAAGNAHADAVNTLFGWMVKSAGGNVPTAQQGRFLYVESLKRWVKLDQ